MKKQFLTIPALVLALAAVAPAQAKIATSEAIVTLGAERLVELTNQGQTTLKVLVRTGHGVVSEGNPDGNDIAEYFVEPGQAVLVKGRYQAYEYVPTSDSAKVFEAMYAPGH